MPPGKLPVQAVDILLLDLLRYKYDIIVILETPPDFLIDHVHSCKWIDK